MEEKKMPCAAVRDLLPLAAEGLCSEETTAWMREHMDTCAGCAAARDALQTEITPDAPPVEEAGSLRAVRKSYRNMRLRVWIIAAVVTVVLVVGLTALFGRLQQPHIPLLPTELSESSVVISPQGEVYARLYSNEYGRHSIRSAASIVRHDTGELALTVYRPAWPFTDDPWEDKDTGSVYQYIAQRGEDGQLYWLSWPGDDEAIPIRSIAVGNDKYGYLILWQEGDPMEELSEETARRVRPQGYNP